MEKMLQIRELIVCSPCELFMEKMLQISELSVCSPSKLCMEKMLQIREVSVFFQVHYDGEDDTV